MVVVRALQSDDAAAFRTIRLRALKEHPEAFGSSYEEEARLELAEMTRWLSDSSESVMFGAFDGEQLVGIAHLHRSARVKTHHRAMLGAMYVAPEVRGQGAGQAIMNAVISHARAMEGLEDVVLAVTVGNEAARRLYIKAGFTPYSIDPRYIRVDGHYFDIEWMILRIRQDG
jgi:RimJ/RimL family protein N-acetyltransferase